MIRIEIVVSHRVPVASLRMRCAGVALLVAAMLLASGCATLTVDSTQSIQVVTVDARNLPVAGMHCEVTHGGGTDTFKSPTATLSVRRGSDPLEIECKRDELIARGTAISRGENAIVHAFIPGGSLGTMIDHLTGNMYSYPTPLRLRVGEHLRFEHSGSASATLVAPVGAQLAAIDAAPVAQVTAVAASTAATPVRANAVRVTSIKPTSAKPTAAAPVASLPVVSDSLDARDLRVRSAAEQK